MFLALTQLKQTNKQKHRSTLEPTVTLANIAFKFYRNSEKRKITVRWPRLGPEREN